MGNNAITIGLPVAVLFAIDALLIIIYICYSKRVSKKRILSPRLCEAKINSTHEIEENYDTQYETIQEINKHLEENQEQIRILNGESSAENTCELNSMICQENEDALVDSPPLPLRPQQCQYIEMALLPIHKNEPLCQDMTECLNKSRFHSSLQVERNIDEINARPLEQNSYSLQTLIDKSIEHRTLEMSDIKISKSNVQQLKLNEHLDAPVHSTRIKVEKVQLSDNTYDCPKTDISNAEENEYFCFFDYHHTSTLDDNTNADNNEYGIPLEPVVYINTPTLTHSLKSITMLDQTVTVNDASKKDYEKNDGFLTSLEQCLNTEARAKQYYEGRCELGTNKDNNVKYNVNPLDTLMKDTLDADNQSYIYPIDPDDPSLPISYGYHQWDGADVEGDAFCSKNIQGGVSLTKQETNNIEEENTINSTYIKNESRHL